MCRWSYSYMKLSPCRHRCLYAAHFPVVCSVAVSGLFQENGRLQELIHRCLYAAHFPVVCSVAVSGLFQENGRLQELIHRCLYATHFLFRGAIGWVMSTSLKCRRLYRDLRPCCPPCRHPWLQFGGTKAPSIRFSTSSSKFLNQIPIKM
ncbi:MAG: hypothetical protein ACI9FJ_001241 [Alteromonadaceae bacterium]|jgi:hypothetical protein